MSEETIEFMGVPCVLVHKGSYRGTIGLGSVRLLVGLAGPAYEGTISGAGYEVKALGDSVAECQEKLMRELVLLKTHLAILAIQIAAPAPLAEAAERFVIRWGTLPPLVRASIAEGLAEYGKREAANRNRRLKDIEADGCTRLLPRRARVHSLFLKAGLIIYDLGLALTAEGDAAAERQGIDADVSFSNPNDMGFIRPRPTKEQADEAMVEVSRLMTTAVIEEQDKAVHEAFDDAKALEK